MTETTFDSADAEKSPQDHSELVPETAVPSTEDTSASASAANPSTLQSSPALLGERVAFTGTLASMTHRQAMELVEQHGGTATHNVSHLTTTLVVGEEGWPLEADGRVSAKLEQARQFYDKGEPVRILSESEWLALLNVQTREDRQQQFYTPAMLSQLLNISVHEIRRWERAGLIKPAKKVFRLSYFDFQEVTGARRLYELAQSGVKLDELTAGLERLRAILPNIERPLAQLDVLARGARLVYRDAAGLIEPMTGQRVFDFDTSATEEPETIPMHPSIRSDHSASVSDVNRSDWTADAWFHEGCRLAEENEIDAAIEAYRLALIDSPLNPAHHFHLADVLYRQGHPDAAIERYYMTVELDQNFIEAWTQLGCLLDETGQTRAALEAFRVALDLHPDFPDAHFHLAELLERTNRREEAAEHWRSYLKFDKRGPWAELARERLELSLEAFPASPRISIPDEEE